MNPLLFALLLVAHPERPLCKATTNVPALQENVQRACSAGDSHDRVYHAVDFQMDEVPGGVEIVYTITFAHDLLGKANPAVESPEAEAGTADTARQIRKLIQEAWNPVRLTFRMRDVGDHEICTFKFERLIDPPTLNRCVIKVGD